MNGNLEKCNSSSNQSSKTAATVSSTTVSSLSFHVQTGNPSGASSNSIQSAQLNQPSSHQHILDAAHQKQGNAQIENIQQQEQFERNREPSPHSRSEKLNTTKESIETVHFGKEGVLCWVCDATFQNGALLRDHLALIHPQAPTYKCNTCTAVYSNQTVLIKHITSGECVSDSNQKKDSEVDKSEEHNKKDSFQSALSQLGCSISFSKANDNLPQLPGISISKGTEDFKLPGSSISISKGNEDLPKLPGSSISISKGDENLPKLPGSSISFSKGDKDLPNLPGITFSKGNDNLPKLPGSSISIAKSNDHLSESSRSDSDSGDKDSSQGSIDNNDDFSNDLDFAKFNKSISFTKTKEEPSPVKKSSISLSRNNDLSLKGSSISVSKGTESLPQLPGSSISFSKGSDDLPLLKGASISFAKPSDNLPQLKGSSISALKGSSISISKDSGLPDLKGSSISISEASATSSQLQGGSVSISNSLLQLKGVSISRNEDITQGGSVSISKGSDGLPQIKGISIVRGNDSTPQESSKSVSKSENNLSSSNSNEEGSLQLKGTSISVSKSNDNFSLLKSSSISVEQKDPTQSNTVVDSILNNSSLFISKDTNSFSDPAGSSTLSSVNKGIQNSSRGRRGSRPFPRYKSAAALEREKNGESSQIKVEFSPPLSKTFTSTSDDSNDSFSGFNIGLSASPIKHPKENFGCLYCRIKRFRSFSEFDDHHINHVKQTHLKVILLPVNFAAYKRKVETRAKKNSDLRLTFRISKVGRGRGRKKRQIRIVSNEEGMSETQHNSEQEGLESEHQEEEEDAAAASSTADETGGETEEESRSSVVNRDITGNTGSPNESGYDDVNADQQGHSQEQEGAQFGVNEQQQNQEKEKSPASSQQGEAQDNYNTGTATNGGSNTTNFNAGFGNEQELGFGTANPSEAPSSTYQPQFESFQANDWFNEYESGPRIAAAMAGATTAENAVGGTWEGGSSGGHADPTYSTANTGGGSEQPVNGQAGNDSADGLFSQAVLGQESPDKSNDRQGSFEQLCLNDSYSGQVQNGSEGQTADSQNSQGSYSENNQQSGMANDLLSELEYLNNSGHPSQSGQMDGSPHSGGPSPHSGGPGTSPHLSSRGSNSGTPTSGGHPTPPPTDTSFRALATSPLASPSQATSPSLQQSVSPQLSQSEGQLQSAVPRLTIANNLLAPTTASDLPGTNTNTQAGVGMMNRYSNQWPQNNAYAGGAYPTLPGTSMANSNMTGPLRAPLPPNVGMPYRPSPPARVRGRPPLMGAIGRPPLHQGNILPGSRGPGRPPTSSILPPPLMPAPGGRGNMMPPLQRMHQGMYQGQRQPGPGPQQGSPNKRPMPAGTGHSPSKNARREDINVPSRQKDTDCQIIAVANRSDGLPVISNVQGGSSSNSNKSNTTPVTTSESTINLSDSITLSVRQPSASDKQSRGEKSGDAGTVANLLASRGITVTPAAGEREGGGGGRDDRRLPTAQELNLSSAISVHPPTQREREGGGASSGSKERDRDGFAVPQAPVRGSVSNNVDRPPRPPTVDLTQEVPLSGSQATRHPCSQCDRTFPSAALLADHSKVHQQQQQQRMPFKCHLCTAGFSTQKGQQHHYQQFHQLQLSAGDIAIPLVDLRNPVNVQRMAALGIRSFLPLSNLQNRGAGGIVGVPILTLENVRNGHMNLQQWGVSDVLSLGPPKTLNMPR